MELHLHWPIYLYDVGRGNIKYRSWYLLNSEESQAVSNVASVWDRAWTSLNLNVPFFLLEMGPGVYAGDSSYNARGQDVSKEFFFILFVSFTFIIIIIISSLL
jgi:hypothetical protein